jgi:histidine ammonia-lyase
MGWHAARKAGEVLANVSTVLAAELLCAAQAIDLRADTAVPGPAAAAVHALIRAHVPAMDVDREVTPQIEAVQALLPEIVSAAQEVAGRLT